MTFAAYQPFDLPVDPPNTEPDEGPFLQPAYNEEWNKYILGVVAALLDPNAYTGDDAAKALATDRAQNLMSIFANAPGIVQFRQVDCTLEYSLDNGDSWTAIFEECLSSLSDAIITAPPSGTRNTITPTTAGLDGLHIVTTGAKALEAAQAYNPSGPHSFPAVQIESDDGPTLLLANGNTKGLIVKSGGTIVDYLGRPYLPQTGDPTPSADTHGAMYRHYNGDGTEEPRIILQLADTSYASVSLKGADGAPGADGTNGTNGVDGQDGAGITVVTLVEGLATSEPSATLTENPDIQHQQLDLSIPTPGIVTEVTATALDSTEAPTVDVSTRTDGDLKLAFGIPAGAPGADGSPGSPGMVTFPELPGVSDEPITFTMLIFGIGTFLPWVIPSGYQTVLSNFRGLWGEQSASYSYIAGGDGTDQTNGEFKRLECYGAGFTLDSHGLMTAAESFYWRARLAHTSMVNEAIFYQANLDSEGGPVGYLLADVTVAPHAPFDWEIIMNFLDTSYDGSGANLVSGNGGGYGCDYVALRGPGYYSGEGWSCGKSGWQLVMRFGLNGGDGTTRILRLEAQGHCAFPNGTNYTRAHDIYAWNADYTIDKTNIVTDGTQDDFDLPQPQACNSHYVFDITINAYDHSSGCPGAGYGNDQECFLTQLVIRGTGTAPTLHTF